MEQQLIQRIESLEREIKNLKAASTISFEVDSAFRSRFGIDRLLSSDELPTGFSSAPLTAVTAPSGGLTVDSAARTAINEIITRLEDLGLIAAN